MATKLWLKDTESDYGSGTNDLNLRSTATAWYSFLLGTSASAGPGSTTSVATVSGTALIDFIYAGGMGVFWYSPPLAADITISGAINWNLYANESANAANCIIGAQLDKIDGATNAVTLIDRTARATELSTSLIAVNFSETPAAGVLCKKGDRLRVRVFAAPNGTMGAGQTWSFGFAGANAATRDSWVSLTENLTFATEPAGTTIYPTNTASDVATAAVDKEAWTSRGAGVASIEVNSGSPWAVPTQWTDAEFGTVTEWYTKKLAAVTLGGAVRVNFRGQAGYQTAVRCEVAVVNDDGSSPSIWAAGTMPLTLYPSEDIRSFLIGGADKAVAESQRLRIRFYTDDPGDQPRISTLAYAYYAGTTAAASGDTWLKFSQTLSIFVPKAATYALTAKGGGIVTPVGKKGAVAGGTRVITYRDTIMGTAGLAAYWRLNETSGGAVDEKGANNGSYIGPIQSVAGAILDGNAGVRATAANCTVAITAPTSALHLADVVSTEAWVNLDGGRQVGFGGIVAKGSGSYYMRVDGPTGKLQFAKDRTALIVASTTPIPTTGWHHVVATKNGATTKLYLDGVDVTGTVTDATLGASTGHMLFFGSDNDANYGGAEAFIGLLDDIAVYNVAVPAADALTHFLASGRQRMFADFALTNEAYDASTIANRFTVNEVGLITAIRYNHHPGDGNTTHHFRIYDGAGALVGTYADPCLSDPTSGWRQFGITPLAVTPGTYTVAWWGAGWYYAYIVPKQTSTSAGLTYLASYSAYGLDQYPTGSAGNATYNLDVVFQPTGAGGTVLTGGGVATVVGVKSAAPELHYGTVVASGGGVIASTYVKFIPEFHSGSASLTGGGVAVLAPKKTALRVQALTGGGVISGGWRKVALRSQPMTGGGIVTVVRSSARSRTTSPMTGGGVITGIPIKKAAGSTQAMTGGGVVTVVGSALQMETKFGTVVATGGGVITSGARIKKATAVAAHTGGGVLTLTAPVKKAVRTQAMTGGGVITNLTSGKQGFRLLAPTGGGVVTLASSVVIPEVKTGTVVVTGGGTIALAATSARSCSLGTSVGGGLADGAAVSPWVDRSGHVNAPVLGSPAPVFKAGILNGKGVVRTTFGEGRYRLSAIGVTGNFTLVYVARMRDGAAGRLLGAEYPTSNFLLGWHGGYMDRAYNGYFFTPDPGLAQNTSFYMYSADGALSNHRLFRDGTLVSTGVGAANDFANTLALGGYDSSTAECPNGDYAEIVLYNYKLSDAIRAQVEGYLRAKWFGIGSSTFTPTDEFGLALWFDADSLGGVSIQNGLTGGGRITYAYATGTPEARTATVAATGGGAVTVPTGVKRVARALPMTGGGVVSGTYVKRISRVQTMTGGGVVYLGLAPAKRATAVATGGGVVSATRVANRRSTPVLTGSGVGVVARSSARARTLPLSGGGTISYAYAMTSTRSAFIEMHGGGTVVIGRSHQGTATVRPTGGGVITGVQTFARFMALGGGPQQRMQTGAPATPAAGSYTLGTKFTAQVDGKITHLRYYHSAGHATHNHNLSLWTDGGTKVASVLDQPADVAGYREVALPTPYAVTAGSVWRVSYNTGIGTTYNYTGGAPGIVSAAPDLVASPSGLYTSGIDLFPATVATNTNYFSDVVFERAGGGMTGGGVIVPTQRTARAGVLVAKGGGVITYTAVKVLPELHSGTARVTGGGTIALTQTKRATRVVAMTGGGVIRSTGVQTTSHPESYVIVI